MYRKKLSNFLFPIAYFLFIISGCTTMPVTPLSKPQGIPGVYHRVEKGQTLWKISKLYNVELEELLKNNNILDITQLEAGQMLFIRQQPNKKKQTGTEPALDEFSWPIKGKIISGFGATVHNIINRGINIQSYANTNVTASRSGKVIFYSPNFDSFGKTLIIDHGDGFSSIYARNKEVLVKPGDAVTKGMAIAKVGKAGRDKNTYLHFEIRKGYQAQNPVFYLPLGTEKK